MHRKKRYAAYFLLAGIDVALIVGSLLAASALYLGSAEALGGLNATHSLFGPVGAVTLLVVYACSLTVLYALLRVYGCTYNGQMLEMAKRVVAINAFGIAVVVMLLFVFHLDNVSRMTLVIFCAISTAASLFKNWVAFRVFYRIRKNSNRIVATLVVGDGPLAQRYATTISENEARLENVIGHVRPGGGARSRENRAACRALGECLGCTRELDDILFHIKIDKIVIALDPGDYADVQPVMAMADKYGTMLELVPFYNDVMPRRPDIDSVDDVRLVNLRSMPLSNPINAAVKRLFDIVASGIIIVAFSWLYVIVAIGVKATSPGPAFFKQERVGLNNKTFNMLKFRSMRLSDGPVSTFTEDKNERKTRFGSFIRKFSIDELPQFFNVLIGQMSIIGPRPILEEETDVYRESISRYMLRNQVRPGISGWAQVNGYRGGTDVDEIKKRTEADLWYIENWSLRLDVCIFARTIFGGFINSEKLGVRGE